MTGRGDYYNTTHETGDQLDLYEAQASRQDLTVLQYFRHHGGGHTPSEVHAAVFGDDVPITSTRRSISNLTGSGYLTKTDQKRRGPYGRREHVWEKAK